MDILSNYGGMDLKKLFALNSLRKKIIAGFLVLTFLNITATLLYELFTSYSRIEAEALDKTSAYAEHIEKIISPIGVSQPEKLQNKITDLLKTQYPTAAYIGVLDSSFNYVANTNKTKIGTEFKVEQAQNAAKTNKNISFTYKSGNNIEYITAVPLYSVTMVQVSDAVSSATAKVNVPGAVIVSINSDTMMAKRKFELIKLIVIGLGLSLISLIIAGIISKTITKPIKIIRKHLDKMSAGDFTETVVIESKDEMLHLADDINRTSSVLKNMITDIKATADTMDKYSGELSCFTNSIASASEEISASMNSVGQNTSFQSVRLNESAEAVNIFSKDLNKINSKVQNIGDNSKSIKYSADLGSMKIEELTNSVKEVHGSFEVVKNKIEQLSISVSQINLITETINSIAKQTNLLSLNASIEAARAGESGKGFVIVAQEVQKLAEQTLEASNQISKLVKHVAESSSVVSNASSEAINKVTVQGESISNTIEVFNNIVTEINKVLPEINEAASTLTHTINMKDSILSNINAIAGASKDMSASTEEVVASVEQQAGTMGDLSNLSEEIKRTSDSMIKGIEKFRI
jgi:methyl-accepting chemotaxis protein